MSCKIKNISARLVSLHLNSGRTVHLAPGLELALEEVEIANNSMFDKLKGRNLLALVPEAKAGETPATIIREAGSGAEAEAPKKTKAKAN